MAVCTINPTSNIFAGSVRGETVQKLVRRVAEVKEQHLVEADLPVIDMGRRSETDLPGEVDLPDAGRRHDEPEPLERDLTDETDCTSIR